MPIPLIWLLLAAGAVAAVASRPKKRPELGLGEVLRPGMKPGSQASEALSRFDPSRGVQFRSIFGEKTAYNFPAPYRLDDAIRIADTVLGWAAESGKVPAYEDDYNTIKGRYAQIRAAPFSQMTDAYKTYAIVLTVVIPIFAANLLWHWYRPRTDIKKKQFAAVAGWATMFLALPQTAMGNADMRREGAILGSGSYLLEGMGDYLNPMGKLVGDLSTWETRAVLYDLWIYLIRWPERSDPGKEWWKDLERSSEAHIDAWFAAYPWDADEARVIEGNYALVSEMLWWMCARVEDEIRVDFDEAAAWAGLIVSTIGALAGAAGAFVSPAVAAIITSVASVIQGLAIAISDGAISREEVQALSGAGIALALQSAGFDLGLGDELAQIEALAGGI